METATVSPISARMTAFCAPGVLEVFDAIVSPHQIWQQDPFDVESIHSEARQTFSSLLDRATSVPPPLKGRAFLLMGEAGSGKTHLMRAFRGMAHDRGQAYFGYLQLTTAASHYGQYVLSNLIKSMETPYYPPQVAATGLTRLSGAVLDAAPRITPDETEKLRHGEVDDLAATVHGIADRFDYGGRFAGCDEDLILAMLFLQRDDFKVRNKVIKWLRCEDLSDHDRKFIGGLVPRTRPQQATDMIAQLGRLMQATQNAAMVLCLDQLEDILKQDGGTDRFLQIVDLMIAISEQVPNSVVLISCLADYYEKHRQSLTKSKLDRLERDPEPVTLKSSRSVPEITAMVSRRLAGLYEETGLPVEEGSIYPFTESHLTAVRQFRTRDVLDYCRQNHERCVIAGQWVEPILPATADDPKPVIDQLEFDQAWNDCTSATVAVPEGELARTPLLARTIDRCNGEIADAYRLTAEMTDTVIKVAETRPGGRRLVVAICEKGPQAGALGKQIADVVKRAGDVPIALVRSTPFPSNPKTKIAVEIGKLMKTGRKVEVPDADWRAMTAFDKFVEDHKARPGFAQWQRTARPLSQLQSVQAILDLKTLTEKRVQLPPTVAVETKPVAEAHPADSPGPATAKAAGDPPPSEVKIGVTRSAIHPGPVYIQPEEIKRHMAFIGGSGSGKTTVALRIIEHLLARGIPAVLIDRKGDLARYADPAAWDPVDGEKPGHTERRKSLHARLDIDLFTPGSGDRGRPLSLPIVPDHLGQMTTTEREEIARYAAESLGGMMQFSQSKMNDRAMLAILAKAIEVLAGVSDTAVTVKGLKALIDSEDETLLNAVGGYDSKKYKKLAESLLTLELQNARLLSGTDGSRVDLDSMFARTPGRSRLTIINTQSLPSDAAIQFWLSQFLLSLYRWIGRHPSPTLQGVLLMDEADQYLPAMRQPPTKAPLESLLKRGRSAGLGVMLATQSPGDLDYKGRDNITTWLIGKVKEQTAIGKLKPMFSSSQIDVAAKLPTQSVGEFFLIRDNQVTSLNAGRSLIRTEQVSDSRILELAARPRK